MTEKKYKSEALAVVHQTMQALADSGRITRERMKFFDQGCLETDEIGCESQAMVNRVDRKSRLESKSATSSWYAKSGEKKKAVG